MALLELLLDTRHEAIRNAKDFGDVRLVDAMSVLPAQHSHDLDTPCLCPEVAVTNLLDQVGHPPPFVVVGGCQSSSGFLPGAWEGGTFELLLRWWSRKKTRT